MNCDYILLVVVHISNKNIFLLNNPNSIIYVIFIIYKFYLIKN